MLSQEKPASGHSAVCHRDPCGGVQFNVLPHLLFQVNTKGTIVEFIGRGDSGLIIAPNEILGKQLCDVMPSLADPLMSFVESTKMNAQIKMFEDRFIIEDSLRHYEVRVTVSGMDKVLAIVHDVKDKGKGTFRCASHEYQDTLTNLPDRYLFKDRLSQALAIAERKKRLLAVLFIDLDNFKRVNETLGHEAGDQLLREVADRLLKSTRKSDSISRLPIEESDPIVARLGGDEFTILLTEINAVQDAAIVSERIAKMLREPFVIDSHEVFVTASIGISLYPFDAKDIDTLLMNADIAMYQAKDKGRNNYQYYTTTMNAFAKKRFTIENKLRKALDQSEFMLFYQPQMDITTGEILGVEALIRWLQPDLVLVKPGEFIPVTEETGLIIPIGEWVLRTACIQSKAWQKEGVKPLRTTVNVSSVQFRQDNFEELLFKILRESGLDPSFLELEITESTIMKHSENAIKKLQSLQARGIQVSIDDFGTGYSSLNYLKRFAISTLKIDRSFIQDMATNPDDQTIVKAIIGLAHNLNKKVIAEGVETRKQLALLRGYGCDAIQGHLLCPPVNASSLSQFMTEGRHLELMGSQETTK
jgi:diguanylate cyclase (GGDEF)-like protein